MNANYERLYRRALGRAEFYRDQRDRANPRANAPERAGRVGGAGFARIAANAVRRRERYLALAARIAQRAAREIV